jgi:hypothetical protein
MRLELHEVFRDMQSNNVLLLCHHQSSEDLRETKVATLFHELIVTVDPRLSSHECESLDLLFPWKGLLIEQVPIFSVPHGTYLFSVPHKTGSYFLCFSVNRILGNILILTSYILPL